MIQQGFIKKIVQQLLMVIYFAFSVNAQKITPQQYIDLYKDIAVREMKRMGVPASITLAQGLLETESGNSELVKKSNNHFGIKCKNNWTGEVVSYDDDSLGECFRSYASVEDSYRDHSNFLRAGKHYAFLFYLEPTDYKGWAYGLKKAGYATNPKYPAILIRHIEQYNLQQYNLAGELPVLDAKNLKGDTELVEKNIANPTLSVNTTEATDRGEAAIILAGPADKINFINGSKCIKALQGTSLLSIATRYSIGLQRLLDINELESDGLLEEEQLVYLQKKSPKGNKDFILVKKNETLYSVAQNNGVQLEKLLEYNQLKEDGDVYAGTRLYLRPFDGPGKLEKKSSHDSTPILAIHEVKAKEGLYAIAQKYKVSVEQLKGWNKLSNDNLQIGQRLIVGQ
jgi:LysM repeat protein